MVVVELIVSFGNKLIDHGLVFVEALDGSRG